MHLEGTKYSLPVNWAMTGLFWNLIYGLCNIPWRLKTGDNERFPYDLWGLNFQMVYKLTAPLSRLLSLACCQVEPEAGNTSDESVSIKKSRGFLSVVLGEWVHLVLSLRRRLWPCAWCWCKEGWRYSQPTPSKEVLFGTSEPKANCWCMACWHAKLCAV